MLKQKLTVTENQLHVADGRIRKLEDCIRELTLQLAEERNTNSTLASSARGAPGDPFIGNWNAGNLRYTPPGSVSPITTRNGRSYSQLSASAVPYTPTTQRTAAGPPVMASGSGPSTGRRHKRTETPEQLFLKPWANGVPIFTFGIDPQNDRGLLHDFFEDVRRWATIHTQHLDTRDIGNHPVYKDLVDMMAKKSDMKHLLDDQEMRKDIVAGLISRHIVQHAIGEYFLFQSKHHAQNECNDLLFEFTTLAEEEYAAKHHVCEKQMALYTKLKAESGHKKWRTWKAEERCKDLLSVLAFFLEPGVHPERDHVLGELYVKGYRIGFRLRMEAVKWQIMWPAAGTDLNLNMMVNQTRNLFGDPMKTLTKLQEDPKKFFVRFALTPTFIKSDFSSGVEEKTVVHSALVHVGRKGVFSHKNDAKL